MHSIFITKSVA